MLQFYDSHIDRTSASARSYPQPGVLRQRVQVVIGAVWIGAGPERDKPVVQKP